MTRFAPTAAKQAFARAVTLLFLECKSYQCGIYAAIATAKNRWLSRSYIVPIEVIPDWTFRRPAFSTTAKSHAS